MKLVTGYKSDRGNTRKVNQDAVVLKQISYRGKSFIILAVCDGIGGLEHGEVASALAVRRIEEWFNEVAGWLDIIETDGELVYSHLKDLAEECNELVRECRVTMQMETGSTMSLLMVLRDTYYIIQVGDSRVYRYRGRVLEQLTEDASVSRMKNGRMKQYLDNYLGKQDTLWFTENTGRLQEGDILLVCSDGLYHHLSVEDIRELEKEMRNRRKTCIVCAELIKRVMQRGERDNITVGIVAG